MDKDIVSTKEEDKPLIYISEEAINLKRDNDKYKKEIERLNNIIFELREKNRNLLEDNMRLRKELNLHSGKLYISDIEVKNVF